MKGFYRSKYTTPDGKDRYAAVTQFEVRLDKKRGQRVGYTGLQGEK